MFLIHPRDHRDLVERFGWARWVPAALTDAVMRRLRGSLGHAVCDRVIMGDGLEVYLLAVLLKGHQMVGPGVDEMRRVRRRILESALYAQDVLGADVIGLGALTASATAGGRSLAEHAALTAGITHGDTFTVRIARDGISRLLATTGIAAPTVAVLGAYGIIGSALCAHFARSHRVIAVGRSEKKLDRLRRDVGQGLEISSDLASLKEAHVVVTATSHPGALLAPAHLRPGALVYDLAQPSNAGPALLAARPDVLRIDGGLVRTPGVTFRFDMRTPRGTTFACLAETILMALAGIEGRQVEGIDAAHFARLDALARQHGFEHAPFTQFGRPVDEVIASRRQAS